MTTTTVDKNNVIIDDTDVCLIVNLVIKLKLYIIVVLSTFFKKTEFITILKICFTMYKVAEFITILKICFTMYKVAGS